MLAHGNVLYSRRGKYAQLSLRPPPHSVHSAPRSRQTMRGLLAELTSGSVLLLHSNEAEHAGVLLEVLRNVTALVPPRVAVSVVSRDDRPMPSEQALHRWRDVRASWQRASLLPPQWFVQNVAGSAVVARPGSEGIHPFPIGVHNPNQLRAFLDHVTPRGLEAQVAQRRTLLMCCCMQADVPERQRALAALARNGFPCDATADQAPSKTILGAAIRSAGTAPSGDGTEAEAAERLRTWPYYATALHSRFVASPAGHGRDCYRTWEALALGAIPVMRILPNASADRSKFENVPVIWVRDWEEVTPSFLRERWRELRRRVAERASAIESRGAHFPFWLHGLTAHRHDPLTLALK